MKRYILILSVALMAIAFAMPLQAQPVLDPTFSNDGYLLTKISPSRTDIARTVLIQPDGRLLVGGNSINSIGAANIGITRLKPNGSYDNNFGTAGIFTLPGGFFCDMALMPNKKIIVAGSGVSASNLNNYKVYRLKGNGSLDTTFGTNGTVSVSMSTGNMICFDALIQPDGKMLLAGYIDDGAGGHHKMLIVRLNRNGSLDNTFATGGKFTLNINNKGSECHELAIQPDGKIVAGGFIDTLIQFAFFRYDFAAVRLNKNGTLDATFGNGGIVRADKSTTDDSYATAILSDGRIVLAGFSDFPGITQFAVLCLMPDGSLDNGFGNSGWKFIDFYGATSLCNAMSVESDDDIVLAGDVIFPGGIPRAVALAKIQSNGMPDMTFGSGGIDTVLSVSTNIGCNDVALQPDNKIVITGYQYVGNNGSYLTARLTNSSLRLAPGEGVNDVINLTVYPNPIISNMATVQYNLTVPSSVTLQLFDMNARLITEWKQGFQLQGNHSSSLSLANVKAGNYIIKMNSEMGARTFKILKME